MSKLEMFFRVIIFTASASCYVLFAIYKLMVDERMDLLKQEIMQLKAELRRLERRWS